MLRVPQYNNYTQRKVWKEEKRKEMVGHKERGRKDNTLYRGSHPKVSAQIHGYTRAYIILGQKIPHLVNFVQISKILSLTYDH